MKKFKIDLVNKKMIFDLTKILNKKSVIFKDMTDSDKRDYFLSHFGIENEYLKVPKIREEKGSLKSDLLASRGKNHFLNLFRNRIIVGEHEPKTKQRYLGIEIECFIPFQALNIDKYSYGSSEEEYIECSTCEGSGRVECEHRDSGATAEAECPSCEGSGEVLNDDYESSSDDSEVFEAVKRRLSEKIRNKGIKGIDIKSDGSLSHDDESDFCPIEITVLCLESDMTPLKKICALLSDLDAEVNASCGLHVHLDSRYLSEDSINDVATNFKTFLPVMSSMVPKSRIGNQYCLNSVGSKTGSRYHAVNLTSLEKFGTIEVRLHSGTTSYDKIANWIEILKSIYNFKGEVKEEATIYDLNLSPEIRKYYFERANKFDRSVSVENNQENEEAS